MQFVLPILYSLAFIFLISKIKFFDIESVSRTKLVLLFLLKLIFGIIVWLVYSTHYTQSDFHSSFSDSTLFIDHLSGKNLTKGMINWNGMFENTLFNNSKTMIIINAILHLFSFGNFYVHIVFFCFFSFVGLTALYKAFVFYFPSKVNQLIISIFFVPSILFWSSAPIKESLAICIIGLMMYISRFGMKQKYDYKEGILISVLFLLLVFVKIYVAIAVLPVFMVNVLIAKTSTKKIILKYATVFFAFMLIAFAIKIINPDYNIVQLIADKQAKAISEAKGGVFLENDKNFICIDYYKSDGIAIMQPNSTYKIKNGSEYISWKQNNMKDTTLVKNSNDTATYKMFYAIPPANSVLEIRKLKPNLIDLIKYSPVAIINVLFQPTLFNVKSWLHLVVAIENMFLILIIILAILFYDKKISKHKAVVTFSLVFAFLLFALIGITIPVIGSIVRYRTIGLLFFVPIILMMIDVGKIKASYTKFKNLYFPYF